MPPRLSSLRTFGIVAHVDAGKTTLTERILHGSGRVHRLGAVDDGTTVTDHDPRERAHGITIGAAAATLDWQGHPLTLVDTPGHVDFGVEVERSLRVLDAAIVVLDAVAGVEPQTEAVWARASVHGLPRIVFINKLDRPGADFDRALRSLEERLGASPLALVVPAPDEARDPGLLIDLVAKEGIVAGERSADRRVALRPDLVAWAATRREQLALAIADRDDALFATLVERGEASPDELRAALRRVTLAARAVPVLSGSAKAGLGVTTLLDAVLTLLPSPLDRGAIVAEDGTPCPPVPEDPLVALCFKVAHDDHGQRSFVRVFSGTLRRGATVRAVRAGRTLRVGRLARLFGGAVEDVDAAGPGEIVALLGAPIASGETLCDPALAVTLEPLAVPPPVIGVAIEPVTAADRDKLGGALRRLLSDDPSLALAGDGETGETVLAGLGELHLEVTLDKLRDDLGVHVRAGHPRVAYRETVTQRGEADETLSKQTGGPGMYAQVALSVSPAPRGSGLSFVDRTTGGVIPRGFVPAIEAGVREAARAGVLLGYPLVDLAVELTGGSFHSHDSSELAFELCARRAFMAAARRAGPALLEPLMRLEVTAPEASLGDVLGDLAARRASVETLGSRGAARTVTAQAPLAELVGYVTGLRSRTQGRGSAAMTLAGYELVPARLVEQVARQV